MADEDDYYTDKDEAEVEVDDDPEMPWESHAREAVERVLAEAEFDEVRGVIYAPTSEDHHGDEVIEGFDSLDDFIRTLRERSDEQWYAYVPFDEGAAVWDSNIDVESIADRHGVLEFFERVKPPEEGEELGTAYELVLPRGGLILRADLSEINDELIAYLAKHPEKMHDMEPRKFEELVAAIFSAKGYKIELTPPTRDGGFDMRAFYKNDVGVFLTLIECKRYLPDKRVSVGVVRGLYGVTDHEKATSGLIVTTSSFTKDAKIFQDEHKHRIKLADQNDLQQWLQEHKRK
jgi:HJR/Mrr/RecB family endonuclease